MRSAIGTCPCSPVSGLSPGPQTAFGTGAKNSSSSDAGRPLLSRTLSAPPIDDKAIHDNAIINAVVCLACVDPFLIFISLQDGPVRASPLQSSDNKRTL